MPEKEKIKRIYALAHGAGVLDSEDTLHIIVAQRTGCEHISDLTDVQADGIIAELSAMCRSTPRKPTEEPITAEQRGLCFRLMYKLAKISPSENEVRLRLRGVIAKVTGREISADGDIFYNVSRNDGAAVIECLKRMICHRQAEIKRAKRGETHGTGTTGETQPP